MVTIGVSRAPKREVPTEYGSPHYILQLLLWETLAARAQQTGTLLLRLTALRWSTALAPPKFFRIVNSPAITILQLNISYGFHWPPIDGPADPRQQEGLNQLLNTLLATFATPRLAGLTIEDTTFYHGTQPMATAGVCIVW